MKYKVIDENSKYFGEVLTLVHQPKIDGYLCLEDNNLKWVYLLNWQVKKLENIWMTPEELSEKAKKYAKMEQRILDWLDVESDKYVIEKLKHLIDG